MSSIFLCHLDFYTPLAYNKYIDLFEKEVSEFMKTLLEMRKELGWSQKKFADYLGISVRTIQNWEQQRREPPEYLAALVERILIKENVLEEENMSEEIIFTDENKLSEYNCKLLSGFIEYLNERHKKNKDVFHCGATVQICSDENFVKKIVIEFNNSIVSKMFDMKK